MYFKKNAHSSKIFMRKSYCILRMFFKIIFKMFGVIFIVKACLKTLLNILIYFLKIKLFFKINPKNK